MHLTPRRWRRIAIAALAFPGMASPAAAQLLGGGGLGGLGGALPRPIPDLPANRPAAGPPRVQDLVRPLQAETERALLDTRRLGAERLIREHPAEVEADDRGAPVVRGRVLALEPTGEGMTAARRIGFIVGPETITSELGLRTATLTAPAGVPVVEALRRLRALDPSGQYDLDHLYQEGGVARGEAAAGIGRRAARTRVGLVDGSAAAGHPALRGVRLTQRAFAPGGARVTAHATAVASLLAGSAGAFRGVAPGAEVLVADVYGPTPAGGSASAIAAGLAWLAQSRVGVVNISLVGPPNLVLGAAVKALAARGAIVVAAVGNDGPAAPPLYPAAYPEVVAVTGVDARRRVLPEAGRGRHVAFAAPGAQMAAAAPAGGYAEVRGTSFAAPIVAGALARELPVADPARAAAVLRQLAGRAEDLGARGRDPIFGLGLVGFDQRIDPARVGSGAVAVRGR